MQLPKWQMAAVDLAAAHLDPKDPAFSGCESVRAALSEPLLRIYLETWVLPKLRAAATGASEHWQRDSWMREHALACQMRVNNQSKAR